VALNLADLQRLDPEQIIELAEAAAARARASREKARELPGLPVFATWEGDSGEAARDAMTKSSTKLELSAQRAFQVSLGAGKVYGEALEVKKQLASILSDAAAGPAVEINTTTNEVVAPDTTGWEQQDIDKVQAKIADLENRIVAVLANGEQTDAELATVISAATGNEPVGAAAQGAADGRSLQDGQPTPEEIKRLTKYTNLTPEQLAALQRGTLVLPKDQMDYLNQLSRSLDGKSPPEIEKIMNQLGPNSGRLADALQLVSNPDVKAFGVDSSLRPSDAGYVPGRGGFDALPSGMRDALTTYPLSWQDSKSILGSFPQARQDLSSVANIVSRGNPALQQGTGLDRALIKQSETMLNESQLRPELVPFSKGQVDPVLENMLSAAGRDQLAVHDALAGANGHTPNDEFIGNLMTHQWSDGGAAAGSLLHGIAPVANPSDLADPTQAIQATRAGETIHAVDQYIGSSSHSKELLDIAGTDNKSLGQLNPELTRAVADANRPYIDDMMSNNLDHTRGFEALDKPFKDAEMPHTRDLFAVVDTDSQAAATLNSQADVVGMQYQSEFGRSVIDGHRVETGDLQSAGTLRGVVDTSSNIAANDVIHDQNAAAQAAYHNREHWFDAAKSLGGQIPGVKDILDGIDKVPGNPLHDMFIGDPPDPSGPVYIPVASTDALQHSIAQQLINAQVGDSSVLSRYIDPATGQLRSLDSLGTGGLAQFRSAVTAYFNGINPSIETGVQGYHDGYNDALPKPPGHTGG